MSGLDLSKYVGKLASLDTNGHVGEVKEATMREYEDGWWIVFRVEGHDGWVKAADTIEVHVV